MWTAFVHACQLLCKKVITKEESLEADQKLFKADGPSGLWQQST